MLRERQTEGGGLARSRLGQAEDVLACEGGGNCLRLDAGRVLEADLLDRTDDRRAETKLGKALIGGEDGLGDGSGDHGRDSIRCRQARDG